MVSTLKVLRWLLIFAAFLFLFALVIPNARAADMLDANGNLAALMTGFCPKTNHFGPCKVKPHMIKPKVKPYLWDKREIQPERIVVDASVG